MAEIENPMARNESDREDLMREATALVRRCQWVRHDGTEVAICGFRREGGLSIYLGADPVYHFDSNGLLRRAFRSGKLLRTQGNTLAQLTRQRTREATQLVRMDLEEQERDDFLAEMSQQIERLRREITKGVVTISQRIPQNDTDIQNDLATAFHRILENAQAKTLAPRIPGKR